MLRQSITKAVRPGLSSVQSRAAFSTTSRAMAGGDTGAPRATGQGLVFPDTIKKGQDEEANYPGVQ